MKLMEADLKSVMEQEQSILLEQSMSRMRMIKQAMISMQQQMQVQASSLKRLEERWDERDKARGIHREEAQIQQQIHVEESLQKLDPVLELFPSVTTQEEKSEILVYGLDATTQGVTSEKDAERESLVSMEAPLMIVQEKTQTTVNHVEVIPPVPELSDLLTQKNETFGVSPQTQGGVPLVMIQEKGLSTKAGEDPLATMKDTEGENQSIEQKESMRKKRKRWKGFLQIQERMEKYKGYEERLKTPFVWEKFTNGFGAVRKDMTQLQRNVRPGSAIEAVYADQVFGKMHLRSKRVKMRCKKTILVNSMGWKYKVVEDKSEKHQIQKKNIHNRSHTSWVDLYICEYDYLLVARHVGNKKLLLRFIKKKKGRTRVECGNKLVKEKNKQKLDMPKRIINRSFLGKLITATGGLKLALVLIKGYINGGLKSNKRNHVKIAFLGSDKLMQLDGIQKFFWNLLLAAVKRTRAKLKYMRVSYGEFFLLSITVRPPKDQGKRNKRRVKNDKLRRWKYKLGRMELSLQWFLVSEKSTEQEMMSWTEGGKTEGRIKLDVLLMELDSTKGILKLHRLETLKNTEVNWRQQMENIDIQRCGLLGSVFLEKENDEIKCLKPVKKSTRGPVKSLRVKHSFEWGNRVWEPGIETGRRVGSDDGNKVKWKFKGEFTAPNPIHVNDEEDSIIEYSVFIAKTNPRQLKFDQVLEWGLGKYVPAVETSTQWRRTGIGVDMSSEQPVEFTWQDYIDVAAFNRDTVEDAIKRNQQRELNENLFALDIAYVLFGAPRPPEQSFTGRGLKNKGWDVHESDEEKQAVEVCDRERKLFGELGGISSTKLLCVHISVLCWEKKDKHEESSVLNERNDANQSMCLNLEDKVDFKGGSIVTCVILMNKAQRR
ncbi:hypothetical protein N665_2608s0004 [Sinapis alba]|nr:hypothetical protein N665_2608s0004 [Sinapis alba]